MQSFRTANGLLAALVLCGLSAACSDPELASELDSDGPPEVLEVNVLTESGYNDPYSYLTLGESATFCRSGEEFRVNTRYCPEARDSAGAPIRGDRDREPAMDVVPYGPVLGFNALWHVRVIFSELLDPDIEELETVDGVTTGHISGTQPVVLRCGGEELEYDGFYDPAGNHLSYPPGPALVIQPNGFVASGTADCSVEVNSNVVDKDGEAVASDQRGPYDFGIAGLSVAATAPGDMEEGVDPAAPIEIAFNAPVDLASAEGKITITAGDVVIPVVLTHHLDETGAVDDDTIVLATPAAPLTPQTTYTVTITAGITDVAGGPLTLAEPIVFGFTTGDAATE